jgi:hypothetical protein
VSSHSIHLAEELKSNPLFGELWNKVKGNETLANRILERTTCSQVNGWCDHFSLTTFLFETVPFIKIYVSPIFIILFTK